MITTRFERKSLFLAVLAGLLLASVPAVAAPAAQTGDEPTASPNAQQPTPQPVAKAGLQARESAKVRKKGSWSVGIFNPLEWSLSDTVAVRAHPWPVLRPVTIDVRVAHMRGAWSVTGEYGLALPGLGNYGAMPLGVKGDLVPSCKVAAHDPSKESNCHAPGFGIVPRVALVASTGTQHVLTTRLDFAIRAPIGREGQPLDALPNLDLAWAAAQNGWRARLGGRYDMAISKRLRWASEGNIFLIKPQAAQGTGTARSPLTLSMWTGVDIAVGSDSRFTIGAIYYNSDQRRTEMVDKGDYSVREPVRSHDIYPTIDFIWSGG